jgi:hopene-associated glycosyltransferase HpnB
MIAGLVLGGVTFAVWLYLIALRGGFWLAGVRDDRDEAPAPQSWPAVTAVVPARDEADMIRESLGSLLRQDYPGSFRVILVDDQSHDGTAQAATDVAVRAGLQERLIVVSGQTLPKGWTGKLWAVRQGLERAETASEPPSFLLLTDADILYSTDVLRRLVARAVAHELVLTSLMVKLKCDSFAERSLVPAFVYFFQMLYPFAWVNRRDSATAAAAGGCMLVDRNALMAAGGIDAIRAALIDDCALGRQLKSVGPIWLGLTQQVRSLRPYPGFDDIRRMVARSAYHQLGYSPLLLAGTVAGLCLTFLTPPALALLAPGAGHGLGLASWMLMAISFQPMLRLYRVSPLWGPALPLVAACYLAFTLDSAYQHARGRGGLWKGRVQASASEMP